MRQSAGHRARENERFLAKGHFGIVYIFSVIKSGQMPPAPDCSFSLPRAHPVDAGWYRDNLDTITSLDR
jgi:hypothetical protein